MSSSDRTAESKKVRQMNCIPIGYVGPPRLGGFASIPPKIRHVNASASSNICINNQGYLNLKYRKLNSINMTEDTKPQVSTEEAIESLMGEQFVEWMMVGAIKTVKSWPEIRQLYTAHPKVEKIRKFLMQRSVASEAVLGGREGDPGFLGFAIANLSESSDPLAENALESLEAIRDNNPQSSEQLWKRLLKAVGASAEEIARVEAKEPARTYIAELSDVYSNSDWQTAIGAFESQRRCMAAEYDAVRALVKNNVPGVSDDDLGALSGEMGHGLALEKLAVDEEGKKLLLDGSSRQLNIRRDFYAGLVKHLLHNG